MDERTPLTDDALDRALDGLLNVRPAVGFETRVRARLATAEPHGLWQRPVTWVVAPGAVLAAAAVLIVALSSPQAPTFPVQPAVAEHLPEVVLPPVAETTTPGDTAPRSTATARVNGNPNVTRPDSTAPTLASVPDFPDVVVSEDEVRTFQRLVALSQQEARRPQPPPAEITAGTRGVVQFPALSFDEVVIGQPALDVLPLE